MLPPIYCKVHRTHELTIEDKAGSYFAKTCELCEAVAMVKAKRRMRQNMEASLKESVIVERR
jgi:hypothetical protein